MTLQTEFLDLVARADAAFDIPAIAEIYIPPYRPQPEKQADFGILALADGSSGLFYTLLGNHGETFEQYFDTRALLEQKPIAVAALYAGDSEAERSLGLAVINAITAFVYRQRGYAPDTAGDSLGELDLKAGDHLGMVGYFKPLMQRIKANRPRITVLEKKTDIDDLDLDVTLKHDPACLDECNKILCTASTLLNNSVESILAHTRAAEAMVIIGPTAGFFPDPLFHRAVSAIGGSRVVDTQAAMENLRQGRGLGDSVVKYLIKRSDYPGFDQLCDQERV